MPAATISAPRHSIERGWPSVSATIELDGQRRDISIRVSQGPLALGPEPFLIATLLPAMRLGADIHVAGSVASHLLRHMDQIQDIACIWFTGYQRVKVTASQRNITSIDPQRGIGCFFSGGVDSFYSVLTRGQMIDKLVFVHGFDIRLDDAPLRVKVSRSLHQAAAELQKPLIEVETNVRDLLDPYTDWARESSGAAVASVSHALSPQLQMLCLSGGRSYKNLPTSGANPVLLSLWSTPELEVTDIGREVKRPQKVAFLAQNEIAMRWLRVCWESRTGAYNCGQCPKCLSTMINLRLAGALDRCRTFERPLDLSLIRGVPFGPFDQSNYEEALEAALQKGEDRAVIEALRECLSDVEATIADNRDVRDEMLKARRRIHHLESKIQRLRSSRSWQFTAPLRRTSRWLRTVKERLAWTR